MLQTNMHIGHITALRWTVEELNNRAAWMVLGPERHAGHLSAAANKKGLILQFVIRHNGESHYRPLTQQQADSMRLNQHGEFEILAASALQVTSPKRKSRQTFA